MCGAEIGGGLPLDVFADLHKGIRGFYEVKPQDSYTKTESEHVRTQRQREPVRFFYEPVFLQLPYLRHLLSASVILSKIFSRPRVSAMPVFSSKR